MRGKHGAPSRHEVERLRKLRERRINTDASYNDDMLLPLQMGIEDWRYNDSRVKGGNNGSNGQSISNSSRQISNNSSSRQHKRRNNSGRQRKRRNNGLVGKRKLLISVVSALLVVGVWAHWFRPIDVSKFEYPNWINQQFITKDGHSRTGAKTKRINAIVLHYTANPGSGAQNNRDYFNSSQSQVSSHFVVGLNGEIIQCVPLDEQSSASNRRNIDTISIEVCHPDSTGEFSIPSYNAAVKLCVWLCRNFRLDEDDIIRHYDCEGANHKLCPKYYVENPDAWERFKGYVEERL